MQREADNPIRTTEWEDIQYQFGNRVGKYETHEAEILLQKAAQSQLDQHLEAYDPEKEAKRDKKERNEEVNAGEDEAVRSDIVVGNAEDSDEEEDFLLKMRQRRLLELQKKSQENRFGVVREIPGSHYVQEITNDSADHWVVAILLQPGNSDCEALLEVMRTVAQRNKFVKFVSMLYTEALSASFPPSHLPCVLLYHRCKLQQQLTGSDHWKVRRDMNMEQVERVLIQYGVLPAIESSDDDGDE